MGDAGGFRRAARDWVRRRDWRVAAGRDRTRTASRPEAPPPPVDPAPSMEAGLVELTPPELDASVLAGGVANHGCVVIRGLLGEAEVARARAAAEAARQEQAAYREGDPHDPAWYHPVDTGRRRDEVQRAGGAANGTVWLADSPRAAEEVANIVTEVGVVDVLTDHFGEPPVISLQKSTLRRVEPESRITTWHQDGAFMGTDTRTMNLWVTLTDCGGPLPAPGLEVIPRRIESILDTSEGMVPFAVPFEAVDEIAEEVAPVSPPFRAGDAVLFDERFLHRTHVPGGLSEPRDALECWFFAPSAFVEGYVPVEL